jgi:hypothetical protein
MELLGTIEKENPMIFLSEVSTTGKMRLTFDQLMYFPENFEEFDYGTVISMQLKSGSNGRIIKSE